MIRCRKLGIQRDAIEILGTMLKIWSAFLQTMVARLSIVLMGDSGVGKTQWLRRYLDLPVHPEPTIGLDHMLKDISLPSKSLVRVKFWDTGGEPKHQQIVTSVLPQVIAAIIMYDTRSEASFYNLVKHLVFIPESYPKMLLGTRVDGLAERQVSYADGEFLARKLGMPFYEVNSSDTDANTAIMQNFLAEILTTVRNPAAYCYQLPAPPPQKSGSFLSRFR